MVQAKILFALIVQKCRRLIVQSMECCVATVCCVECKSESKNYQFDSSVQINSKPWFEGFHAIFDWNVFACGIYVCETSQVFFFFLFHFVFQRMLNNNHLTGTIPTEIEKLTRLSQLYVAFEFKISNFLVHCFEISLLAPFHRQCPTLWRHCNFFKKKIFLKPLLLFYRILSHNSLSGTVPLELLKLNNLKHL